MDTVVQPFYGKSSELVLAVIETTPHTGTARPQPHHLPPPCYIPYLLATRKETRPFASPRPGLKPGLKPGPSRL